MGSAQPGGTQKRAVDLTYSVQLKDSGWYWEVRNGGELVVQGEAKTMVAARVAALRYVSDAYQDH